MVLYKNLKKIMMGLNFNIMLLLMIFQYLLINFILCVVSIKNYILGKNSLLRIIKNIKMILMLR